MIRRREEGEKVYKTHPKLRVLRNPYTSSNPGLKRVSKEKGRSRKCLSFQSSLKTTSSHLVPYLLITTHLKGPLTQPPTSNLYFGKPQKTREDFLSETPGWIRWMCRRCLLEFDGSRRVNDLSSSISLLLMKCVSPVLHFPPSPTDYQCLGDLGVRPCGHWTLYVR